MALSCQVSLSYASYTAGQNPPPMATVLVFNPGAASVVVTGITIIFTDRFGNITRPATSPPSPPIGPGMTVLVPTLSSITIGPFPIVMGSAGNANSFQAVNPAGVFEPINPQHSQPMQRIAMVGALVNGSDGSSNIAGAAALLVSYTSNPPVGYQGGFFNFAGPNNFITGLLMGAL